MDCGGAGRRNQGKTMDDEKVAAEKRQVDGRPVDAVEPGMAGTRLYFLQFKAQKDNLVPAWGDDARDEVLQTLSIEVDLLSQAVAFLQQKVAGMAFVVEGPERTARKYRA